MAVGSCSLSSSYVTVKSPTDRRLYRFIQLPNGLCALLVHDPEIYSGEPSGDGKMETTEDEDEEEDEDEDEDENENEEDSEEGEGSDEDDDEEDEAEEVHEPKCSAQKKAAAAMCVGIVSFADPYEAQGLAHFLGFRDYIFCNCCVRLSRLLGGGWDRPSCAPDYSALHSIPCTLAGKIDGGEEIVKTETEHTCYHFEVKREFLKGALTRFAQFFTSPLVKAEAMEREVLAVDSEFNQVLQNDSCRLQQLQCHTSAPGHPFNRFFWGSKKSLADAVEKGIDLRDRILKLYRDSYYGGSMKLVVIGGESLEVLESWVVELFSSIKKGLQAKPEIGLDIPIWRTGKLYWLEAVKDVHVLDLSWTLPSLRKDYMKKAEDYLAHLLGHGCAP